MMSSFRLCSGVLLAGCLVLLLAQAGEGATVIAHWPFDEVQAGTPPETPETAGYTGGPYTGTLHGNPALTGAGGAIVGDALAFDGNDYVRTDQENDSAGLHTDAVSVSAWVYPTALEQYTVVAMKGSGNLPDFAWQLRVRPNGGNGDLAFAVGYDPVGPDTDEFGIAQKSDQSLDQWYHLVGTYDGSDVRLYVNGDPPIVTSAAGEMLTSTKPITISTNPDFHTQTNLVGTIDDLGVWDGALSGAEARALYTLASDPLLGYNLGNAQRLFAAYQSDEHATLENGDQWLPAQGLNAIAPGGAVAGDVFWNGGWPFLLMDAAGSGTGMTAVVPEPPTICFAALVLFGWLGLRRRRARKA